MTGGKAMACGASVFIEEIVPILAPRPAFKAEFFPGISQ
jgi:hypothetical protein